VPPLRTPKTAESLPVLHPDAAGIDIGATEVYAAVPRDRDSRPVRAFSAFTPDLYALADWLLACGVRTVAMESTGVYWIPLYAILEGRGIEVCLVNARHVRGVPGRTSDVADCQWLQYLHAVGLLSGSFRPPQEVCAVRSVLRHRDTLVGMASAHTQHMQKALSQMNLHLHHALSDLTGKTGRRILDAILAGERDPEVLAGLRDRRVKASAETLRAALTGDYREEHLFTLRQAYQAWQQYQGWIAECDAEIARLLGEWEGSAPDPPETPSGAAPSPDPKAPEDLGGQMARILGVDLTEVPGLQAPSVHRLFAEIGRDLTAFPTAKQFASWLGLCPDNRVSGGKVLSVKTRKVKHRAATVFRLAAQTLHHSKSSLGEYYRRMRTRLGAPKAITAAAHKLARIVYHLLKTKQPYDESVFAKTEAEYQRRRLQRLRKEASALGFTLAPHVEVS
jgi:transposase